LNIREINWRPTSSLAECAIVTASRGGTANFSVKGQLGYGIRMPRLAAMNLANSLSNRIWLPFLAECNERILAAPGFRKTEIRLLTNGMSALGLSTCTSAPEELNLAAHLSNAWAMIGAGDIQTVSL